MKLFVTYPCWFCFGVLLLTGALACARADDVIPKPFPADHYARMAAHSPFAPPTAPAPPPTQAPPPPKSSFTDKLTAIALMQSDGVYSAVVVDQDTQAHLLLTSKPAPPSSNSVAPAMAIASVKWNPSPGKNDQAVITLRKGTEFGTVRYEPSTGNGAVGGPGLAGNLPRPGGGIMPPVNRPYTPPVIPGSQSVMPNPGAFAPSVAQRRGPIRGPQPPPATGGRPIVPPGTVTTLAPTVKPGALNADDDDDD